MPTIEVSRATIIKAVREEPGLFPGLWVRACNPLLAPGRQQRRWARTLRAKTCGVCAFGAVLRAVLAKNQDLDTLARAASEETHDDMIVADRVESWREDAARLVERARYMNALSVVFEGAAKEYVCAQGLLGSDVSGLAMSGVPRRRQVARRAVSYARREALAFVRAHFPPTVRIDIDGARPARGVAVVG